MILNDRQIAELCAGDEPMLSPDKTDPEAPYGIIPTSLRMTRP